MDNGASSYRRFLDGDEHAIDEIMEELFFPLVFFINRYVQDVPAAETPYRNCSCIRTATTSKPL